MQPYMVMFGNVVVLANLQHALEIVRVLASEGKSFKMCRLVIQGIYLPTIEYNPN